MESIAVNLSMAGVIRTKEKCPRCGGAFKGPRLTCPSCLTSPERYMLDLHAGKNGRVRLYSDRQGRPLSSYELAERVLTGIRYEIDQKLFDASKYIKADVDKFLFEKQVEAWYEDKKAEVEKGNRAKGYVRVIRCYIDNYYLDFFKGHDVREIRTHHIKEFYRKLPKKSLKYLHNILSALENFFNTLIQSELIDKRPMFPAVDIVKKTPRWVDFHTQIKIIKSIPKEDRPIFLFLAWQGVRPGEARALKVKDVDLRNQLLHITRTLSDGELKEKTKGKNEKTRVINPALLGLLYRHCANKHPESFVFINPQTGGHYSETSFRRRWDCVGTQGFNITPYQATRHSLASRLVEKDVHLKVIKDILGHTDIRTTLKYAHSDLKTQKIAFDKLQEREPAKVLRFVPNTSPSRKP